MTSVPPAAFVAGLWLGLAVAVPIGPMGVLCVQRTLSYGLLAGLATGLAAATVQVSYGTLAVFGVIPAAMAFVGASVAALSGLSGVLLLWFAHRTSRSGPAAGSNSPGNPTFFGQSYRQALALGYANPMTVLLFAAAFPALASVDDTAAAPLLVLGVFTGAIGWYIILSSVVSMLRQRGSTRALALSNKLTALALATLGASMLGSAIGAMLQ